MRATAQAKWEAVQSELRTLLQKGADLAYLDGAMDSESKERYYVSGEWSEREKDRERERGRETGREIERETEKEKGRERKRNK